MFLSLVFSMLAAAVPARAEQSISDLPLLSGMLVDHYECRLALNLSSQQSRETTLLLSPKLAGHQTAEAAVAVGSDVVVASVNSQALQLKWARSGRPLASALTMIQNSSTQAYVLIVYDPSDEDSHADLSCSAMTFADLKGSNK